jgi:HEAT repeat protein
VPEAEAAAIALGNPGEANAVAPLAKALERSEPRVRMAAIRGLGGIGTPEARAVLDAAASSHADPATRRRAAAEAALLAQGASRKSP